LSPILKHRETIVLNIQYIVTRQWLKLHLPNFHTFTLIPYLQEHPLCKNQAAKFPTILDNFFTQCSLYQHGWVAGAVGRQDGGFKFVKRKDALGQVMGHARL